MSIFRATILLNLLLAILNITKIIKVNNKVPFTFAIYILCIPCSKVDAIVDHMCIIFNILKYVNTPDSIYAKMILLGHVQW